MSTQPFDQDALQKFLLQRKLQGILANPPQMMEQPPQQTAPAGPGVDIGSLLAGRNLASAQNAPVPDSPVDTYTKAIQNQPKLSEYHPSFLRRLGGIAAGVGTGLAEGSKYKTEVNPAAAHEQVEYAPFLREVNKYRQSTLEPARLLAEGYSKEQAAKALQEEEAAHGEAYKAEVGKYGAEQKRAEKETLALPGSYEEVIQGKEREKRAEEEAKATGALPKLYDLTRGDGTKVIGATRLKNGNYLFQGQEISPNAITEAREQGAPSKESTIPEEQYFSALKKELGRDLTSEEIVNAHHKMKEAGVTVKVGSGEGDYKRNAESDREIKQFGGGYQKNYYDLDGQLKKVIETQALVHSSGYVPQALASIKMLTSLVSGQGTGVRITKYEIDQIANARGIQGSFEAWLNRQSGTGSLGRVQQQQMNAILEDVKQRLILKQEINNHIYNKIEDASSRSDRLKADQEGRAMIAAMEAGLFNTKTVKGRKYYTIDGGKTVLPYD